MRDKQPSTQVEVVILAAGKGTRMKSDLPKVLHQVAGKALLQHVIDAAKPLNPKKIHIVIGHGKDQIKSHFAQTSDTNIVWVEQDQQLGTGHAVQLAIPQIDKSSSVLMLTADVPLIGTATLAKMVDHMRGFPLALLTGEVPDPTGLGRIIREGDGVVGIVEHKDCTPTQLEIKEINSGLMCARASELNAWLEKLENNNAQKEYYLTDIVEFAVRDHNPVAALHPHDLFEIEGINSRSQLAKVERIYQQQRAEQLMDNGVTILDPNRIDIRGDVEIGIDTIIDINTVLIGPLQIGSSVMIGANCHLKDSKIGNGTEIHPYSILEGAVIGEKVNIGPFARLRPGTDLADEVRVGNFVEVKNAQLKTGAKANHLSYVGDATVGSNTNIGAGVITCNYDGANKHKTKIGDNVFVGSDSQLIAPIEIADGATVGAGSTITSNVKENQLAISRARQRQVDDWQRPIKKTT